MLFVINFTIVYFFWDLKSYYGSFFGALYFHLIRLLPLEIIEYLSPTKTIGLLLGLGGFNLLITILGLFINFFIATRLVENKTSNYNNPQSKVKVTDLLNRLNEEKKIEKKRNLALGVAAVSAVTVFGIILTI